MKKCLLVCLMAFGFTSAYGEVLPVADPLVVAPFVPPVPKEPKEMPDISVEDSVEGRMENSKQLRIVRAEASQLPDLSSIRQELERLEEVAGNAPDGGIEASETNHRFIVL